MIGKTTDAPSRLRYLRHRSSARCPCLMINKTGHLRGARAPVTAEDLAALQTDVLAGFVLARPAAGAVRRDDRL